MILAADFGGTTIKMGVVRHGVVSARLRLEARSDRPMTERLEAVANGWEELLAKVGSTPYDCDGTALALPFVIDAERSRVLGEFGKFPSATEIDFTAWSQERLRLPTALENDLRVALLGEWELGAARGKRDVLMLALGTGIGCAAICGNRLLRGANNRAAMLLGHSSIDLHGPPGRCGNTGCAEDFASTATLEVIARRHRDYPGSELAMEEKIDFETVFRLAAKGDGCSKSVLEESLKVWATVLQNAVLAYDPAVILLGGGVLRSAGVIIPVMEEHMRRYMPALPVSVPIIPTALGEDAPLLGAEVLFRQTYPAYTP
jgi:glucokinase